jgi:hypothetical protein
MPVDKIHGFITKRVSSGRGEGGGGRPGRAPAKGSEAAHRARDGAEGSDAHGGGSEDHDGAADGHA